MMSSDSWSIVDEASLVSAAQVREQDEKSAARQQALFSNSVKAQMGKINALTHSIDVLLAEAQQEDVKEFSSVLDNIRQSLAFDAAAVDESRELTAGLTTLERLLTLYQDHVRKLTSAGRLVRFLTSHKHRRTLEHISYQLDNERVKLNVLFRRLTRQIEDDLVAHFIDSVPLAAAAAAVADDAPAPLAAPPRSVSKAATARPLPVPRPAPQAPAPQANDALAAIDDAEGQAFWQRCFGAREYKVPFAAFVSQLRSARIDVTPTQESSLRDIVDASGSGYVSVYKFGAFLEGFGPFRSCVDNVDAVVGAGWFHWHLSSAEAARLLTNQAAGTFLVRFSKSKGGSFAIAVKDKDGDVKHVRIERGTTPRTRFALNGQQYVSLEALVQQLMLSGDLVRAFGASYYREPWFQGDLSELEASEVLSGTRPGTFLVRFNLDKSGEHFVISYVDSRSHAAHVNVNNEPSGLAVLSFEFAQRNYEDLREIIAANPKLLQYPCSLDRNLFGLDLDDNDVDGGAGGGGGGGGSTTMYGAIASVKSAGPPTSRPLPVAAPSARALPVAPGGAKSPSSPNALSPRAGIPIDYGAIPGKKETFTDKNTSPRSARRDLPTPVAKATSPTAPKRDIPAAAAALSPAISPVAPKRDVSAMPVAPKRDVSVATNSSAASATASPAPAPSSPFSARSVPVASGAPVPVAVKLDDGNVMMVTNQVVLGASGSATVQLPAKTAEFHEWRVQVTPVGAHAPLYIVLSESSIGAASFQIEGGRSGLAVHWQAIGVNRTGKR